MPLRCFPVQSLRCLRAAHPHTFATARTPPSPLDPTRLHLSLKHRWCLSTTLRAKDELGDWQLLFLRRLFDFLHLSFCILQGHHVHHTPSTFAYYGPLGYTTMLQHSFRVDLDHTPSAHSANVLLLNTPHSLRYPRGCYSSDPP